jgi:hypothetical protein
MLPPGLKARAEQRAREQGSSLGEVIRGALEAALEMPQAADPLFSDDVPFRGEAPSDLASEHDRHLYDDEP